MMVSFALVVFLLSLFALAYTYVGYPLCLWFLAKIFRRPIRKASYESSVTIIVVAYNAAAMIEAKIRTCLEQDYPSERISVLIVSDGSTDETCALIDSLKESRVRVLSFAERRGKAACLNDAVAACKDEVLVFTDVRQRLHPAVLRTLTGNLADSTVGAVSGQLLFEREGMTDVGESLDAYWRYEKLLRKKESEIASCVGVTGALYALRRALFVPIAGDTILDDVLIPMNAVYQGKRVIFENDAIAYDRPSSNMAQERVRKVRTLAGNFQLISRKPSLLFPGLNPIAFQFFSHKVTRLISPLMLLLAFASNAFLVNVHSVFAITFGLQVVCYVLAVLGQLFPALCKFLPVRILSAFVSLNGYVVLGLVEFAFNRQAHLWQHNQSASRGAGAHNADVNGISK
jgi:poly-beta-1,6-N-acetyl-D-glucosamine synthase